ncbi:hypothetical protein [Frondihabitans australicus]|uniref:hypothetical protein n=1 Tax=Frondihabitans australicus TaxID=386892 RepID=UPI000EB36CBA|nr:hypothetical protein [Frondihabitans australicus]
MSTGDDRRRRLQEAAFGGDATDEQRRFAAAELRRLAKSPTGSQEPVPPAPRRTWPIIVATAVVALAVGAGAGWAVGHAGRGGPVAASAPSASGDPAATSRLEGGDPAVVPSAQTREAAADALLATSRSSSDALPSPASTDGRIVAATSHLVTTSAQGERLYIARRSGAAGGFCFVTVSDDHSFGETSENATCTSPASFDQRGLTLASAGYTAVWAGGKVSVTVTNGSGG